jgi:UDP-N-acetylmuramate dehydrogenase
MNIQEHVSLRPYNTFGFSHYARYFTSIGDTDSLQAAFSWAHARNLHTLVLGGGSNILLRGDFHGLVIHIAIKGIGVWKEDDSYVWVKCGAGEIWHQVVLHCIAQGWGGLENLSLIPGTVGAAPMQNIGAYGVEIKDVFDHLEAFEIATGELRTFDGPTCKFGYRESIFKHEAKGKYIISSVTFRLTKHPEFNTTYGALQETLEKMNVHTLNLKAVSDAVIHIRQSKLPDPAQLGNAGSFFKNPVVSTRQFEELKNTYPDLPSYPQANGVKVPAGWLIEACGWKGKRMGAVGVHHQQALVLVNYGEGTGEEVEALARSIQESVKEKFGIDLQPEVNFI